MRVRFCAIGASLIAATFLLVSCNQASTAPSASPPATAKPAAATQGATQPATKSAVPTGELRLAAIALGDEVLDPILGSFQDRIYFELMFDWLVGLGPDSQPSEARSIAEKWEISPDNKVFTFHIRQGVKFQNGDDLTAADTKFTLERQMSKQSKSGFLSSGGGSDIDKIEVLDPYTMRVTLKRTNPFFFAGMTEVTPYSAVMPKKYIEAVGEDGFAQKPIGSGPYKFVAQSKGDSIKLEAMDKHWKIGVPKYKNVTFRVVPEEATMVALLKRGDLDQILASPVAARNLEGSAFKLNVKYGTQILQGRFHNQWEAPFDNAKVRQALNLAIDRKSIIDTLYQGFAQATASYPTPKGDPAYKDLEPYAFDPARAKTLLSQSGIPNPKVTIYAIPLFQQTDEAIASMWKTVGVDAQLQPIDYGTYKDKWMKKALGPGAAFFDASVGTAFANTALAAFYKSDSYLPAIRDSKLDELLNAMQSSETIDQYKERAQAVQSYVRANDISIPIADVGMPIVTTPAVSKINFIRDGFGWGLTSVVTQ